MRDAKEFSDVTLACEDGQLVEAHKVILAGSGHKRTIHILWFKLGDFVFHPPVQSFFFPYWKSLRLDISTHLLHMPYDLVLYDRSWKKRQLLCLHTFTFIRTGAKKNSIPGLLLKSVDEHDCFYLHGFGAARTTLWSRLIAMTITSGKLLLDGKPPPTCYFFLAKSEQGAPSL